MGNGAEGTARVGREATSGSNPRGTSGASWQGVMVPAVVSRVPTVETVEPDSQRKSRLVGLGEVARGSCPHQKPHVERRSGSLWRDQGSIAFMIRGIAKEDTPGRARSELMRRSCNSVRVTRAAKNSEMLI
jgi:hypothetical protein